MVSVISAPSCAEGLRSMCNSIDPSSPGVIAKSSASVSPNSSRTDVSTSSTVVSC